VLSTNKEKRTLDSYCVTELSLNLTKRDIISEETLSSFLSFTFYTLIAVLNKLFSKIGIIARDDGGDHGACWSMFCQFAHVPMALSP